MISSPVAVATIRISTAGVTLAAAGVIEGRADNAEGSRGSTSQLGAEMLQQGITEGWSRGRETGNLEIGCWWETLGESGEWPKPMKFQPVAQLARCCPNRTFGWRVALGYGLGHGLG